MSSGSFTTGGGMLQGVQAYFPFLRPEGYFTRLNVDFLKHKIGTVLKEEYGWFVAITSNDLLRVMQRVVEERVESIPRMNERVVMEITSDYRQHMQQLNRNLKWEEHFMQSSLLFDNTSGRSLVDVLGIKTRDSLAKPRSGGTLNFYFT